MTELYAIILFITVLLFLLGTGVWVGLALDEPRGRHHGVVDGKQYFRANVNCGIFAQPAAVVRLAS